MTAVNKRMFLVIERDNNEGTAARFKKIFLIDLSQVAAWCPRCFVEGRPVPPAEGLDAYLGILGHAYMVPVPRMAVDPADPRARWQ